MTRPENWLKAQLEIFATKEPKKLAITTYTNPAHKAVECGLASFSMREGPILVGKNHAVHCVRIRHVVLQKTPGASDLTRKGGVFYGFKRKTEERP